MTTDARGISTTVVLLFAIIAPATRAVAVTTEFFSTNQVATLVSTGTTFDTISSEGYRFAYTRDKLFTGGVGLTNPVGRFVRVSWPTGVEAQAVTAGEDTGKARITLNREDGAPFDLASFTARLLANTIGAGGSIEIMPILEDGEDAWNNPAYFFASGISGNHFTYDTTPSYLGSTAGLTNFHAYKITLYVDFALTALTLVDGYIPANHPPTGIDLSNAALFENDTVGAYIGSINAIDPDAADYFTYTFAAGPGDADNARFAILGDQLHAAESFNFELRTNYTLRIEASDQGSLSIQTAFAISILDVDEPPPVIDPPGAPVDGNMVMTWTGQPNHTYSLLCSTNLLHGFTTVHSNLASPDLFNVVTDSVPDSTQAYWMLSTEP